MPMEISMTVTGRTTRHMDSEVTPIPTEPNIKVTGKMINNMEKVRSNGLMVPNTQEATSTARRMVSVSSCGLTNLLTMVSS